jgi:hypothetical protein
MDYQRNQKRRFPCSQEGNRSTSLDSFAMKVVNLEYDCLIRVL